GQVLEEDLHELFLAEVEDEIALALAAVGGLAAAASALPVLRPLDAVAAHVLAVAGVHHLPRAAASVAEHRLGDVALGDLDVLALLDVAYAAPAHGAAYRVLDLVAVAPQEALAVADGFVLPRQPPVDDVLQRHPVHLTAIRTLASPHRCALKNSCERAGTTRTAGGPAWACSPFAPFARRSPRASSPRRHWPWR